MTRNSIAELATALRPRYLAGGRQEKQAILDEFCLTTGYHRKSAIRLLSHNPAPAGTKTGRPKVYGPEVAAALQTLLGGGRSQLLQAPGALSSPTYWRSCSDTAN